MPIKYSHGKLSLNRLNINLKSYYNLLNSGFWGLLSTESQPQHPELRNNPENFQPCESDIFCCLMITFANSLQPDQAGSKLFDSWKFFKKVDFEKTADA